MTVATETASITHTGNGVTTAFSIPFKFLENDHIQITKTLISTGAGTIMSSSEYTLSGAGEETGGEVTISPAVSSLYEIYIERIVPYTQDLDLEREGSFYPEDIETQLDKIVMMIQAVRAELAAAVDAGVSSITRSVSGPSSSVRGNFPSYSNTTGTVLADSGYDPSDFALETHTHADAWTQKEKAADSTRTSTTTLSSDADLTFSMLANTVYVVEGTLFITSPISAGMKVGITGPASPTLLHFAGFDIDEAGSQATFGGIAYATNMRANTPAATEQVMLRFTARIHNGSNAGTFAVQFAQNASNATASTLRKGSYIRYKVM